MRAAAFSRTGPAAAVLDVLDLPDPQPGPGEVRVRIAVSGVNPTDWKARASGSRLEADGGPHLRWPLQIPHQDGSGVIDAVGRGIDRQRVGQRVWVYHAAWGRPAGTAAELVCVPARQAVPLPDGIPFTQAAGLGIPYITAHRCLFADGPVAGRSVLVTGGAGAVGNAAVQLARWAGATVIATVSTEEKARIAAGAGAHRVLRYTDEDHGAQLSAAAGRGVDRVVDVSLWANLPTYAPALAPHAAVASYATTPGGGTALPHLALMEANTTLRFVYVYTLTDAMLDAAVHDITTALSTGAVQPLPEHRFPLERIAEAQDAVQAGAVGKVLVEL